MCDCAQHLGVQYIWVLKGGSFEPLASSSRARIWRLYPRSSLPYLCEISERLGPKKPSTASDFEAGIAELVAFQPLADRLPFAK